MTSQPKTLLVTSFDLFSIHSLINSLGIPFSLSKIGNNPSVYTFSSHFWFYSTLL